jgi:hypothetical protein
LLLLAAAAAALMALAAAVAGNMLQAQPYFHWLLLTPLLLVVEARDQPLYFPRKQAMELLHQH